MLKGKGIYIWRIRECEGGNIANIVTMCQNANFSHVIIKIAEGTYGYNYTQEHGDMAWKLADALEAVGIEPWGYQFIYAEHSPELQAATAARRVRETGVRGFIINAESSFNGFYTQAQKYVDALQDEEESFYYGEDRIKIPIALSSFRYQSVHQTFPWDEFHSICDLTMPQVYWMQAHNPAEQLKQCINEYAQMTDLPVVPTGSAFCEHGWCPTTADIVEFSDTAKMLGLPGINFWEWSNTRANNFWGTVRDIDYPVEDPEQPDCCAELVEDISDLWDLSNANAKLWFDVNKLVKEIEMELSNLQDNIAVSFITETEVQQRIDTATKDLQDQIDELNVQIDHKHPPWMRNWGLVI